jgi:hypothetical protein
MTTFTDSYSLSDDTLDAEARLGVNIGRAKQFCRAMVDDGAFGIDLVYAMAYVAVELGLRQTDNSFFFFPRISQAIADAGYDALEQAKEATLDEEALIKDPSSNVVPMNSLNVLE